MSALYDALEKRRATAEELHAVEKLLVDAHKSYNAALDAFTEITRRLGIADGDHAAFQSALRTSTKRAKYDRFIDLSFMKPAASWRFHPRYGRQRDEYCSEPCCDATPDVRVGFWQSEFSENPEHDHEDRLCDACFRGSTQLRKIASSKRVKLIRFTNVEALLYNEECSKLYRDETMLEAAVRARDLSTEDEWRVIPTKIPCSATKNCKNRAECISPGCLQCVCAIHAAAPPKHERAIKWKSLRAHQKCLACDSAATYVLVGYARVRVCETHFKTRDTLSDELLLDD